MTPRSTGGVRRGVDCGQPQLRLPHPTDPAADPINAAHFARLTGLPRGTVLHRYRQLVEGCDVAALSRDAILAALMLGQDRRVIITLPLPDGRVLSGGVRAVIAQVLADPALCLARAENLGRSAFAPACDVLRAGPVSWCRKPCNGRLAFGRTPGRPPFRRQSRHRAPRSSSPAPPIQQRNSGRGSSDACVRTREQKMYKYPLAQLKALAIPRWAAR